MAAGTESVHRRLGQGYICPLKDAEAIWGETVISAHVPLHGVETLWYDYPLPERKVLGMRGRGAVHRRLGVPKRQLPQ